MAVQEYIDLRQGSFFLGLFPAQSEEAAPVEAAEVVEAPAASEAPKRLLLISCSATKCGGPLTMPAIERYDGPKFRVLRKFLAEAGADVPDIRILSAAHGLIAADYPLANYNVELGKKSADVMASSRIHSAGFAELCAGYDEVFVMAGGLYVQVLQRWAPKNGHWKLSAGRPGERLQQFGRWLRGQEVAA